MNGHVAAIKAMDSNVAADGTGGYLGSKSDQVSAFLSGTGATLIVNLHLNGRLPADKVPHSFEDVCTLLTNWVGSVYESDADNKRPAASIMASHEAEGDRIFAYGKGGDKQKGKGERDRRETLPNVVQAKTELRSRGG